MIGILAYGSLITHPGQEIESVLDHVIPDVMTPFPVEYARRSQSRAGAPTLVPVPTGCGASVKAVVLVLMKYTRKKKAMNFLYRREIHREGDLTVNYDDQVQRQKRDALVIETMKNQFGLSVIYYTALKPNFTEILDTKLTQEQKAELLARAAIDSVTQGTYAKEMDGLQYLADNIEAGVVTVLTEVYAQAILNKVGNVSNLSQARWFIAQKRGITA
jgi:cation transport regulator ChaC